MLGLWVSLHHMCEKSPESVLKKKNRNPANTTVTHPLPAYPESSHSPLKGTGHVARGLEVVGTTALAGWVEDPTSPCIQATREKWREGVDEFYPGAEAARASPLAQQ